MYLNFSKKTPLSELNIYLNRWPAVHLLWRWGAFLSYRNTAFLRSSVLDIYFKVQCFSRWSAQCYSRGGVCAALRGGVLFPADRVA